MSGSRLIDGLPAELVTAQQLVYEPCGFACTQPMAEKESAEYSAYAFQLNGVSVKFRKAKITPKKTGQFVTLWQRNVQGITRPHAATDGVELVIIHAETDHRSGQFIFPKEALIKQGIFSTDRKEGKRGFRVYPPWDRAENAQAKKTQAWQLHYFLELSDGSPDLQRAAQLLNPTIYAAASER